MRIYKLLWLHTQIHATRLDTQVAPSYVGLTAHDEKHQDGGYFLTSVTASHKWQKTQPRSWYRLRSERLHGH